MIKYCRVDVEVLSRAVLVFRNMFYDNVNIDPCRYITLPSLCMYIYKARFLPVKPSVANDASKPISKVSRGWIINLDNSNMHTEKPLCFVQSKSDTFHKHETKIIRYERGEPVEFDDFVLKIVVDYAPMVLMIYMKLLMSSTVVHFMSVINATHKANNYIILQWRDR